jgi:anti-sigma B factor antagonist
MTANHPVIVQKLPASLSQHQASEFVRQLEPSLRVDRPCLVFDFSEVRQLDSSGVRLILQCTEEAMKRNGDLKLAAIPPPIAVILKLTGVDCLFEIFDNAADAVESFYRFPVHTFRPISEGTDPRLAGEERSTRT